MYSKKPVGLSSLLKYQFLLLICILVGQSVHAQRIGLGSRTAAPEAAAPSIEKQLEDYANPKEFTIAGITVSGTQFLDPNSMISISGLKVGNKIRVPGVGIPTAVKKMMDFGTLDDVEIQATKIEGEEIHLNIHIQERPRLYQVTFSGIKKGQRETLNDKVKLIKGRVITPTVIKNTQLLIKKHYQDKGFYNTTVKVVQIPDSTRGQATLNFIVDKGKKVRISNVDIQGNEAITDKKLAKRLKGTKQKTFYRFWAPSKYVPKKYDEDKEKLIEYYRKNGYRDAVVLGDSVYKDPKTDELRVKILVDEGPKYFYRNISWTGNYLWSDEVLNKRLGITKGDVYNPEDLDKRLNGIPGQDVSSLYMDDGYLYYRLNPVEVAVEGDSIDIEMRMFEGKQATINRIILDGNTKTSDRVVLRELFTLPGQKFSKSNLIDTQRQLSQMGYFNPEKINIEPIPNQNDGTVDIKYTVEEKPSDQIELSGGWGGYIGFVGTLGLVFNNFSIRNIPDRSTWRPLPSGDGQKLALRFQANGRQFQTYSLSFNEPWLGGKKPINFGIALTRTVYRMTDYRSMMFGNAGSRNINYLGAYYNNGITFSLGKRLKVPDRNFQLTHALSLQRYRLDSLDFFSIGYNNGYSNNITFNTTLSRNTLSDFQYPRSGSSLSLSATVTPPYSLLRKEEVAEINDKYKWIEYHKWMLDMSWFQTITGKLVLNTRAHMGFLGGYNRNMGISPFGRFIVGGSGLAGQGMFVMADQDIIALRGYEDRSVGPLTSNSSIIPAGGGGVVYNKYVMEVRYPVSLNPQATIFLLAFAEGGNNWGSYKAYNPFDIKRSAGVGARIFMPAFGLLGIDWGYGFDKIQGRNVRSGAQFHFTIGQQLR